MFKLILFGQNRLILPASVKADARFLFPQKRLVNLNSQKVST